jgi:hypothetical protein
LEGDPGVHRQVQRNDRGGQVGVEAAAADADRAGALDQPRNVQPGRQPAQLGLWRPAAVRQRDPDRRTGDFHRSQVGLEPQVDLHPGRPAPRPAA